jgi:uncharacterized protein YciI
MATKYVLFYESEDDVLDRAAEHMPSHSTRGREFHERGELIMYGPFSNPVEEGSMSIFRTREGAEEFARGDPFVVNGLVRRWFVREWQEAFSD